MQEKGEETPPFFLFVFLFNPCRETADERFRIDEDALDLPSCIGNGARKDIADLSRKIHVADVFRAVCPEPESALCLSPLFDIDHMRCQLPATSVAGLHDSQWSLALPRAGTQLTQIQPGLSHPRRDRIEASQLEGGSLASCHARRRVSPYGLSTGS